MMIRNRRCQITGLIARYRRRMIFHRYLIDRLDASDGSIHGAITHTNNSRVACKNEERRNQNEKAKTE